MKNITLLAAAVCSTLLVDCDTRSSRQLDPSRQTESGVGTYIGNVSHVISVRSRGGKLAPDFTWYDEHGKLMSFSDFSRDNVVLINFWATWCGPCKRELPDLVALSEKYQTRNIKILGISIDKDANVLQLVHDFARQQNIPYPVIVDNGDLEKALGGVRGIPTSFFINREGSIVHMMLGIQARETFSNILETIAREG